MLSYLSMLAVPHSIHLANVARSDEGVRVMLARELHKLGEFFLRKKGLYLNLLLPAESSLEFIQAAAALEVFYYELAYGFVLGRDYADSFALVECGSEIIYNYSVDPGSNEAN